MVSRCLICRGRWVACRTYGEFQFSTGRYLHVVLFGRDKDDRVIAGYFAVKIHTGEGIELFDCESLTCPIVGRIVSVSTENRARDVDDGCLDWHCFSVP